MRRSSLNIKFLTTYFLYITVKQFNQTQVKNRAYAYLYYDTIVWLLWKIKNKEFFKIKAERNNLQFHLTQA